MENKYKVESYYVVKRCECGGDIEIVIGDIYYLYQQRESTNVVLVGKYIY